MRTLFGGFVMPSRSMREFGVVLGKPGRAAALLARVTASMPVTVSSRIRNASSRGAAI
jgi:hypothetical protein